MKHNLNILLFSLFLFVLFQSCGQKSEEKPEEQAKQEQTADIEAEKKKLEAERKKIEAEKQALEAEKKKIEENNESNIKSSAPKAGEQPKKQARPEKSFEVRNVSFTDAGTFSDSYKITYLIVNKSAITSYKNLVFRVEYLNDENQIIGTKHHNYNDDIFSPKSERLTTMKSSRIKGTTKMRIVCENAEAVR